MGSKSGIYCIENLVNHKKYIGQSKNLKKRLSDHLSELRNGKHFNDHLQRSWDAYGQENFNIYVICYCNKEELDEKEIYYIDFYNTMDKDFGYNKDSGGNKYKTRRAESREKMRLYWKEHGGANDGLLQATIRARKPVVQYTTKGKLIAEFDSIVEASESTGIDFRQISAACVGKYKTSMGFVWRFKGEDFNKFEIYNDIKTKKKVIQYTMNGELVNEYPSIHDAHKETGVDYRNISAVCNGKRKSSHGYIWEFAS